MGISTVVLAEGDLLQIKSSDNVLALSVQAPTGATAKICGSQPFNSTLNGTCQQVAADEMSLATGEGFTVVAFNVTNPIDRLSVCAYIGSVNVLIQT